MLSISMLISIIKIGSYQYQCDINYQNILLSISISISILPFLLINISLSMHWAALVYLPKIGWIKMRVPIGLCWELGCTKIWQYYSPPSMQSTTTTLILALSNCLAASVLFSVKSSLLWQGWRRFQCTGPPAGLVGIIMFSMQYLFHSPIKGGWTR